MMARIFLLCCLVCTPALAQDLAFLKSGKEFKKLSLDSLKKQFPPKKLKLKQEKQTFLAIPLEPILVAAFGKGWASDSDFFFVCRDGYRSPVPTQEIRKYPAYLAYAYADGKPFKHPKENKDLGPFYLVWDTNLHPERATKGSWPYQVLSIDRQSFAERYAQVMPPPKSSAQVQHGFAMFRKYCISCHKINGQGGEMAIDLNAPYSVTEYIKEPFLEKIIDNPQKVRNKATMPGLLPNLPDRQQVIKDIVAYLKAKAAQRAKRN